MRIAALFHKNNIYELAILFLLNIESSITSSRAICRISGVHLIDFCCLPRRHMLRSIARILMFFPDGYRPFLHPSFIRYAFCCAENWSIIQADLKRRMRETSLSLER
jgi:hypothetical protein